MKKFLKGLGLILAGVLLLTASFVWIYAPLRARSLSEKYAQFREQFQPTHDAIDALFNHQDRVVNGIKWHYVEDGARDGKVVLFLHGLPEGWYSWRYVLPQVDRKYRLIAVDMKGYGRSDLQDRNYNWHHVANQTVELMDSLGIDRFYVVSHDWGSVIGSVLVGDHPERIRGFVRMEADLIMKSTTGKPSWATYLQKPQWFLFQNHWFATFLYRDAGWLIDTVYPKRMLTPFKQIDRDYLVYEYSRPGVAEMNPKYFQSHNWDLQAAIGKICKNNFPFPVLQLQADNDPAQPKAIFADVATECPNVQIQWVTNASHFDNFDQPGQVAKAINDFLYRTDVKDHPRGNR
jgi:pimeloyl-ACP methyl ester carboxylesterase